MHPRLKISLWIFGIILIFAPLLAVKIVHGVTWLFQTAIASINTVANSF